jgi:hypothetical protein
VNLVASESDVERKRDCERGSEEEGDHGTIVA